MARVIRPGTAEYVQVGDRIRHCIVTGVDDQDNITVRLGGATESASFAADRESSTKTRGTLFVQE